jgi:toxin FitB
MQFLVDANVLSEATKPTPADSVINWLERHELKVAVNPIILGELQYGILMLPAGKRRSRLLEWFSAGVQHLPVMDIDAETARIWASLLADLKSAGRSMSVKDSLIAATARQHRLTIATRNTTDFKYAGTKLVNPFEE